MQIPANIEKIVLHEATKGLVALPSHENSNREHGRLGVAVPTELRIKNLERKVRRGIFSGYITVMRLLQIGGVWLGLGLAAWAAEVPKTLFLSWEGDPRTLS